MNISVKMLDKMTGHKIELVEVQDRSLRDEIIKLYDQFEK